jgi:hypothetical protein
VSCAISKAQAARELLDLAYEHFDDEEGETLSWARSICFDAIDEALKDAHAAYVKVATEKPAAEATR